MQLSKYSHSCVRFAAADRSLIIDPGVFSEFDEALDGAEAVLITHEHPDHVDVDRLRAAVAADSRLRVWAPPGAAAALGDLGEQVVTVGAGETFEAAGFTARTFGGRHAQIHATVPIVDNVGYLIEGVFHPGDSFSVPTEPVQTLLLPTAAPWSKMAEVIDFAISVRAPRVHQIHDAIINDAYANIVAGHLGRIAGPYGVEFSPLAVGQTVDA